MKKSLAIRRRTLAFANGMLVTMAVAIISLAITGCSRKAASASGKYVASTSWVAAIADLAGIEDIITIAPAELTHPPEYEITADDIAKISKSDLFLYAGYEKMMDVIKNSLELPESKFLKVRTQNKTDVLEVDVMSISAISGTEETGAANIAAYKSMVESARSEIRAKGLDRIPAYVNANQTPLAQDLGLYVADTFGPGPLTAGQIESIAKSKYPLIIDNIHNPVIKNIGSIAPESHVVVWRNFPERLENGMLMKLVRENIEKLTSTF